MNFSLTNNWGTESSTPGFIYIPFSQDGLSSSDKPLFTSLEELGLIAQAGQPQLSEFTKLILQQGTGYRPGLAPAKNTFSITLPQVSASKKYRLLLAVYDKTDSLSKLDGRVLWSDGLKDVTYVRQSVDLIPHLRYLELHMMDSPSSTTSPVSMSIETNNLLYLEFLHIPANLVFLGLVIGEETEQFPNRRTPFTSLHDSIYFLPRYRYEDDKSFQKRALRYLNEKLPTNFGKNYESFRNFKVAKTGDPIYNSYPYLGYKVSYGAAYNMVECPGLVAPFFLASLQDLFLDGLSEDILLLPRIYKGGTAESVDIQASHQLTTQVYRTNGTLGKFVSNAGIPVDTDKLFITRTQLLNILPKFHNLPWWMMADLLTRLQK